MKETKCDENSKETKADESSKGRTLRALALPDSHEKLGINRLLRSNSFAKDDTLQQYMTKCDHHLKIEDLCRKLQSELSFRNEQIDVLKKTQVCMQQHAHASDRKHREDMMSLVNDLEKSRKDLCSQEQLVEILARDLQKMKFTFEYCKHELLRKDNKVKDLEENMKKIEHSVKKAKVAEFNVGQGVGFDHKASKKALDLKVSNSYEALQNITQVSKTNAVCAADGPDSWQEERSELQAMVTKLTRKQEVWKFEKETLVSALQTAKREFNHTKERLNFLQEKLRKTKRTKCRCETPQCYRVVEKHHHYCGICRTNAEKKDGNNQRSNRVIISLGEQLREQLQIHHVLEDKVKCMKRQLNQRLKKLKNAEQDRAAVAEQLADEQTHARMMKYDMEYQMSLLHNSLLESSARLENVTSQLRESCHQKVSMQKDLEGSLISLQEGSVDELLENSAKELEFKSMKLLQRLTATRLQWGPHRSSGVSTARLTNINEPSLLGLACP